MCNYVKAKVKYSDTANKAEGVKMAMDTAIKQKRPQQEIQKVTITALCV